MQKVLYHTIFEPKAHGHGGEKRTAQIQEDLVKQNYEIIPLVLSLKKPLHFIYLLKSLNLISKVYSFYPWKNLKVFLRFWKHLSIYYPQLEDYFSGGEHTFIWESTRENYFYLAYFAKKYHKKIIGYPHNIESLVPEQEGELSGICSPKGFSKEIKMLKMCDKIYVNSREDNLYLQLFNVNSFFYAYKTPHKLTIYLDSIKEQRQNTNRIKKSILILGTAINPPTRRGMEYMIKLLSKHPPKDTEFRIGGYGTEVLKDLIPNTSSIKLLGTLSKKELEHELIYSTALLINQPATTGALNRIYEFSYIGLPIIANSVSARTFYNLPYIHVFNNDNECLNLIENISL